MPNYQGQLDGLCGPYAVVNAFEHCGLTEHEELFTTACTALAPKRWPRVLWEGTTFRDLQKMIKSCRTKIQGADLIKTSYPFQRSPPKNNNEYWKRFDQLFIDKPNARCMIIGLKRPSSHWIVACRESGKRMIFVDTDPHKPFQRKNRAMLYVGHRNGHPNKWIIDLSELIVFEVE